MTSILNLQASAPSKDQGEEASLPASEYEIVLGRPQIASWLFVGVVAVAVCSSLAYLGGEKIAAKNAVRSAAVSAAAKATPPNPAVPAAPIVNFPKTAPPLFYDPQIGKVYLQIAAVERGMAGILAEGLRSHGFASFAAPGPNDKIFRVLIGPLPDPQAFEQAMVGVSALDLALFARKYQK